MFRVTFQEQHLTTEDSNGPREWRTHTEHVNAVEYDERDLCLVYSYRDRSIIEWRGPVRNVSIISAKFSAGQLVYSERPAMPAPTACSLHGLTACDACLNHERQSER